MTALAPVSWGTTYVVVTELLPDGRPLLVAAARVVPAGLVLVARPAALPAIGPPAGAAGAPAPDRPGRSPCSPRCATSGCSSRCWPSPSTGFPAAWPRRSAGLQPLLVAGGTWSPGAGGRGRHDLAVGVGPPPGWRWWCSGRARASTPPGSWPRPGANASFAAGVVLTRRFPVAPGDRLSRHRAASCSWAGRSSSRWPWRSRALPGPRPPPPSPGSPTSAWSPPPWPSSCGSTASAGCRSVAPPLLGLAAPATGAATGWVVLGQSLSPVQLTGFAVILGGDRPRGVARGAVDRRGQPPGRQEAVAVGEQLGGLGPVDASASITMPAAPKRRARAPKSECPLRCSTSSSGGAERNSSSVSAPPPSRP